MRKTVLFTLAFFCALASVRATPPAFTVSGWLEADIGSVTAAGSSSVSTGTYTISDRGNQVWGKTDQGRYVYNHGSGNGQIVARVATMSSTSNDAQACVAIRETLLPNSKMAAMCATPKRGIQFITRKYDEHPYQDTAVTLYGGAAPAIYLRLTLTKNTTYNGVSIVGEYSFNGSAWTQLGSTARITMLSVGYTYGMLTSSHDTGTLRAATFDNVSTAIASNGLHYYASPTASGSGDGSFANPWTIKQALNTNAGSIAAGSTLWLRGGVYLFKNLTSTLAGTLGSRTTVRSYPGEQAKLDGGWFTTLSSIASSGCSFTVNDLGYAGAGTVLHVISKSNTGAVNQEDINVTNMSGNSVTSCVRGWNGTSAVAHQNNVYAIIGGAVLTLSGNYVNWYDLEAYNSEPNRVGSGLPYGGDGDSQNWPSLRGPGLAITGTDVRNYFNVLHDNSDGLNSFVSAVGGLWYGGQTYNNGTGFGANNNRGNGHGIYVQNFAGTTKTFQYSVSANNFATAYKFGAVSGDVSDLQIDHLIGQHGGAQGGRGTKNRTSQPVLEVAADSTPLINVTVDNLTAFARFEGGDVTLLFGYTAANNRNGIATNNYLVGGGQGATWRNWQSGSFSNNTIYITNGDSSSDTQMVSFTYTTQGAYSGSVDTSGTTATRVGGDYGNASWGTGCVGCPSTMTINGSNYTIVSVNDAGSVFTITPSAGTQTGVPYAVNANTEAHPLSGQVTFNNNSYYSGVQLEGYIPVLPSSTRYQYQFTANENGQIFQNEFGGGRSQFTTSSPNNDWKDWLTSRNVAGADAASSWTLGKPTGTVVRFNPTITYESARGWVAYIGVINWNDAATVTIPATSLDTVLASGDRFEIRKLENACGAPTYTGTYAGSDITISTADRAVCGALNNPFVHYSGWPRYNTLLVRRL